MSFYSPSPIVYTKQEFKEEKREKVDHRIELKLSQRGLLLAGKVLIMLCSVGGKKTIPNHLTKTRSDYSVLLVMDFRILHNSHLRNPVKSPQPTVFP